jgi:hypothetical protein
MTTDYRASPSGGAFLAGLLLESFMLTGGPGLILSYFSGYVMFRSGLEILQDKNSNVRRLE